MNSPTEKAHLPKGGVAKPRGYESVGSYAGWATEGGENGNKLSRSWRACFCVPVNPYGPG